MRDGSGRDDKENLSEKDCFFVAELIAIALTGNISPEKQVQLDEWINESEEHKKLYLSIIESRNNGLHKNLYDSFDLQAGWDKCSKIPFRTQNKKYILKFARYAALFLLVGASFLIYKYGTGSDLPQSSILPGKQQAQLITSGGKVIDLQESSGLIGMEGASIHIKNNEHILSYETDLPVTTSDIKYNELIVPKCGEYQLKLNDGTLVYINAESRIKYPVQFTGDTREVELEGEAYFVVKKDINKPFIVKTSAYDVTVLGTEFNISAYRNEGEVRTTLVSGRVAVNYGQKEHSFELRPDEQLTFNEKENIYTVSEVDTRYYTSWKDGMFRFDDMRLEEIMRIIERWYDIEVEYMDENVKNYRFGFNFSRYETVEPLVRIFEVNGRIRIIKDGNKLKIYLGR